MMAMAALVAVLLIACGTSAATDAPMRESPANTTPPTTAAGSSGTARASDTSGNSATVAVPAFAAPNFSITMFQGQQQVGGDDVGLHQLLGDMPVVVNFWAGLCPPCRAEMPDLQAYYEEFDGRSLLVGVDIGQFTGLGTIQQGQDLLDDLGVTYPAGFTNDAKVISDYRVLGMPSTIFIDANGDIFDSWTGALNTEVLREKTLEMLAQ